MSPDVLATIGASQVQHGPLNDRIYLMKLAREDCPGMAPRLERLARRQGYGKIFAKVPHWAVEHFQDHGFSTEAVVPGLLRGREAVHFMARYLKLSRRIPRDRVRLGRILALAQARAKAAGRPRRPLPRDCEIVPLGPAQAEEMAAIYARVFESYPFPVQNPEFLRRGMAEDVRFFGVRRRGELAALASAEIDREGANAEMTDFATLPEHRGQGLASALLEHMGRAVREEGVRTLYTIARAASPGMNAVFARAGYRLAGTLPNNTHIAGSIETMNVWSTPPTSPPPSGVHGKTGNGSLAAVP